MSQKEPHPLAPGEGLDCGLWELLWECSVSVMTNEGRLRFAADYHKMAKYFTEFTNINRILEHLALADRNYITKVGSVHWRIHDCAKS